MPYYPPLSHIFPYLALTDPVSRIIPGATSFSIRNHADAVSNVSVSDAGVVSLINSLNIAGPNATTTIVDITDSSARDIITMRTQIPTTPPAASNILFGVGQFPSTLTALVDTYVAHFRGIGQGSDATAGQSVLRVHFVKATDYAAPWNTNYNGTQLTAAGNFQNDSTGGGAHPITGTGLGTPAPFASNCAIIGVTNSITTAGWNIGGLFVSNKSTVINIGVMGVAVANAGGELNNIGVLGVARDTGGGGISNSGYFWVSAVEPPIPVASSCVTFDTAATAIDMVHGLFNTGNVWTIASRGTWSITPTATAGGINVFSITPPNIGTVTAEKFSFNIVANTVTVTAGYTTQRFAFFAQPTMTAATSQTVVNAATVAIEGAPIPAGVGPLAFTVTPWSLWVQAGSSSFGGSIIMGHSPSTINATATATAAQVASGYIKCTSSSAVTITLPTGTLLGAILGASQGTVHFLTIDNTASSASGIVTIAVAVNGILSADAAANAGSAGLLTIPVGVTGQGTFMLMFSSATAYTFSRIA